MDARGATSGEAEPNGKPDDTTKGKPKDNDGATEGEAAAASGQQKPKPNGSFSATDNAVVASTFETAHLGVKALQSGSANLPAAVPSKNSQVNWSEMKCTTAPAMTTAKTSSSGYPTPDIWRPVVFNFGENQPIANSQVNPGALGQAAASPMATPSPFIFGNARPRTEKFVGFSFGANSLIPGRQGNHSDLVHLSTVSNKNGLPKPNGSFSVTDNAVVAPASETAHLGVKELQSGSANPPAAVPSKNSQVNWSEMKCTTAPAVTAARPFSFGYPTPGIGSPVGFDLGENQPVANSQVNQGALGQAAASSVATPPSPFIFGNAQPHTVRFVGFTFGANPSIPGGQGNHSHLVHPPTLSNKNGLPSVFANGQPDLPVSNLPAGHGDTVPETPNRASGPAKITFTAEPQKTADDGKKKKEKRKKKKQRAARPSKYLRDDEFS